MGAVYQAWDAELGVTVALKVIRPDAMADPAAAAEVERRFKRELLLARQVTHRNVVRIHDIGTIQGIKYITMSFVDGTDLATLLRQEGAQPIPRVIRVARSVVSGLVAAHAAGVVHRDLKPANIMIDADGEALIMDFGIARSTGDVPVVARATRASLAGVVREAESQYAATIHGAIVGTVEYMAPEQARGEAVDQRADIYAFGLILYDALVGRRRAEHAGSALAELQKRFAEPPPSLRTLLPDVPDALEQLVMRCLQPDAGKRYQTSAELATDLDRLDDRGELIPVRRVLGVPLVAAIVVLLLALTAGTWWYSRVALPPAERDPVSVLIADVENLTGDGTFDHVLEPMLKLALEEAGFISAFDRTQIRPRLGVQPPDVLDEQAAQTLAVNHGVGVVLTASLAPQSRGYVLRMKAAETVTGNLIADTQSRVSGRDQVLAAATRLSTDIRTALGDDTSDSARRFAMDTLSATSLDVVRSYAAGMEALSDGRFDEALVSFKEALDSDQGFGLAYVGMASSSRNLGRVQDAERYATEAVRHVGRMTERERYRARGVVYMATADYQQCVKEFGDMLARYAADVVAYNNLAFCHAQLRDMPSALSAIQRAAELLPKRALYRLNLALYSAYAGDFEAAEVAARTTQELGSRLGLLPLAYAQLGGGQVARAAESYGELASLGVQGASFAASGLGDIAMFEGRFDDAVRILEEGAAADVENGNVDRAAAKLTAQAHAHVMAARPDAATASAARALDHSQGAKVRFQASRIFIETGQIERARELARSLAGELQPEPRAYARILEGKIAARNGDHGEAIKALGDANALLDTWVGQFELGKAQFEAGLFTQADSAFDRCIKRRGELFLDEDPSYGQLPAVYYYQGRVRQALNTVDFAESYRTYLAIREKAEQDPLLPEVRQRAGS
jgi:eukaryotic-like serine/threonine-protein kinase